MTETMAAATAERPKARRTVVWSLPSVRWAVLAVALFLAGLATQLLGAPEFVWWTAYLGGYVAGGWMPARDGLVELTRRRLDVDLLMIVAAIGAAAVGQVFDGALLIVIFATSGALEDLATRRTEDSVRALLDLAPERAVRVDEQGEREIAAEALRVGDLVVVRPGERIPADAIVVDGASDVDQSSVTGESVPASKLPGDEVFAGTLNGAGVLRCRVARDPADSVVARIVAMVADASATKAGTQLFIEKVEQRYSVVVVVATLALFAVPLAFGEDLRGALLRAMTFMIVASPCAVVLATMPPLLSAIANAGRHGVLVKSAVALEHLADVEIVAFDKTGTLTSGRPRLSVVEVVGGHHGVDVLRLAAAAEQYSEHPLGRAVTEAARERGITVPAAGNFLAIPGRGVRATVGANRVQLLSPAALPDDLVAVQRLEESGATAVVVVVDDVVAGVLGLRDTVRPGAAAAIGALAVLHPVLITGDNAAAAAQMAAQIGITEVHAGLLPEQKVDVVRALPGRVLVVGDGVNDAPAMAAAHTSIAMGGRGADLTLQTADAVTVADELGTIPAVVALARRARRMVVANLAIAATFITVLVVWDLFWYLPLPLGVAGHEGSTILVACNGLRLLRDRAWPGR